MTITPFLVFSIAMLISFLGTIPFGPINLSVVDTSINKSFRAALAFALAAAVVEILQSFVALHCSALIDSFLNESALTKILAVLLLFGLGLMFWFKKPKGKAKKEEGSEGKNDFFRGFIISILNPQAIPFWIFALSYLKMSQMIALDTKMAISVVAAFLFGVAGGKFLALLLFAVAGKQLKNRIGVINRLMNKIIGGILLGIGVVQLAGLVL